MVILPTFSIFFTSSYIGYVFLLAVVLGWLYCLLKGIR